MGPGFAGALESLGPPVSLYRFFGWEGSPIKIDYRQKGTLILTSLLGGPRLKKGLVKQRQGGRKGGRTSGWIESMTCWMDGLIDGHGRHASCTKAGSDQHIKCNRPKADCAGPYMKCMTILDPQSADFP